VEATEIMVATMEASNMVQVMVVDLRPERSHA